VLTVALDGCIVHADAGARDVLGLPEPQLAGRRVTELVQPDDAPGEQRYVRPDGAVRWLLVDAEVAAPAGDPQHFVVRVRDVTDARAIAHAEREAHAGRPLLEGSWVIDAEGRTTSISPGAAEMLGLDPEALRGRPVLDFVAPEDRALLEAALERRRSGVRESYEVRWLRADGGTAWVLMSAAPLYDTDGRYVGAFSLVTDVSDRRREEERVRRYARQQEAVADLGALALRASDPGRVYDVAVQLVADVLGTEMAGVFELREGGGLALVASYGLPPGVRAEDQSLRREEVSERWLAAGAPYIVEDWLAPDAPKVTSGVHAYGARSSVIVPITGRRAHGLLGASRRTPWRPEEDALDFLRAVAHVLAGAVERAAAEEEARRRAMHDALTGLPNRALALDRLEHALQRLGRGSDPRSVAVVVVDLDRFKEVNEELGYDVGDGVLRALAPRLLEAVRPADTVARLGGDSFAVLCEDLADDDLVDVAERLVLAVRAPVEVGGEELRPTASAGVATAGAGGRASDLLRDAETAMSRAKAAGGDRFEVFDRAARARALDRLRLERDLRRAISGGELFLVHQPVVGVHDGHVAGVEALVRWRHPARGVVSPEDFIGIAESGGLIGELGAWVLRTACAELAACARDRRMTCHVNLSPRQADGSLPGVVRAALDASGLPPEQLVLELTESSLMEAGEGPLEVLQAVRELGVRLVLDDFGTGYSSLARLRHFPIDGLKVDRSFVAALDAGEPADALLVGGIVELGRALGLTVVAEGVETASQLERLRVAGCRYAQGFLLARPAPRGQLDELLARPGLLP
jgi:diguanylate cyclase (GGDEF)-like protein/PAS domain S-box-containing protein